ncbi:uncharacterized protein PV07_08848 [Cladophialophora immunda]|uniref:Uncharacterized protein n=1 Tax=Cladophialophora immunda TaxID=569365 RepID=A0A0D2AL04_9EURO|nr:uncharacterized protein PV07_08848 [Cladophialophora immunda]KIW25687.1 hypothetical protein PV07_08848 [Cladophialophora immunda]OQU96330.1 hypothetical protein CLAIMM_02428 [Cladophialophora immunda]
MSTNRRVDLVQVDPALRRRARDRNRARRVNGPRPGPSAVRPRARDRLDTRVHRDRLLLYHYCQFDLDAMKRTRELAALEGHLESEDIYAAASLLPPIEATRQSIQRLQRYNQSVSQCCKRFHLAFNEMRSRTMNVELVKPSDRIEPLLNLDDNLEFISPDERYFPKNVGRFWSLLEPRHRFRLRYLFRFYKLRGYKNWAIQAARARGENTADVEPLSLEQALRRWTKRCLRLLGFHLGLEWHAISAEMTRLKQVQEEREREMYQMERRLAEDLDRRKGPSTTRYFSLLNPRYQGSSTTPPPAYREAADQFRQALVTSRSRIRQHREANRPPTRTNGTRRPVAAARAAHPGFGRG